MSQSDIRNTKNIAKNTVFLYLRSIIVMAVGIYTSRVVLQALGVEDYGVYNVIGGFVAMFSILSASLVNASQRFISFEMGKQVPQMNRIFCGTMSIHLLLALIVFFAFETFGIWFLNTRLNIAPERMTAANWVFQCSVLTFCINLISVPFNASIIAHERMNIFAYISIYEVFVKLGIVYLLWVTGFDKLIAYAILMLAVSVSLRIIYGIYCKRQFEECHFHFKIDKPLFKDMLGFTGWNFIGSTANIFVTQGISVLVNIFFGVALNAARGVAEQLNNAVNQFVTNFMTAMNPQITKSFSSGKYDYMNTLMVRGAKYAAILYWFISLTLFIEADYILDLWLVIVPEYAPLFLRLVIIYSFFQSLSYTLFIGMLATGNIRNYQIAMGALYIVAFFLCWFLFKMGMGPEFGYISTIIAVFIGAFLRLYMLNKMIPYFSIKGYLHEVVLKVCPVIILSTLFVWGVSHLFSHNETLKFVMTLLLTILSIPVFTYVIALDGNEKELISQIIKNRIIKILK